jgi:hypothetical protein
VHVLTNFKKHVRGACGMDQYSSALWFEGLETVVIDAEFAPMLPELKRDPR